MKCAWCKRETPEKHGHWRSECDGNGGLRPVRVCWRCVKNARGEIEMSDTREDLGTRGGLVPRQKQKIVPPESET